jgi:hypothetical protein
LAQGAYAGWPSNNEIEEYEDCQWEVSPTGGVGTYSYQWQKSRGPGWSTISGATTQELYIADVGGRDFGLRTIITSGTQTDTTAVLEMTVDPSGQTCIIRSP